MSKVKILRTFLIWSGALMWLLLLGGGSYLWFGGALYVKHAPLFDALICAESLPLHVPLNGGGIYLRSSCVRGIYQFRGMVADVATVNSDSKYLNAILSLPGEGEAEKMMTFWISHGANINIQSNITGATLLEKFANTDDADMVELLIKHGARTDIHNKVGQTPLEAVRARAEKTGDKPNEEIVKLLGG